jgi:hypothetical protein
MSLINDFLSNFRPDLSGGFFFLFLSSSSKKFPNEVDCSSSKKLPDELSRNSGIE